MTKQEFVDQIVGMQDDIYRVSHSLLQNPDDPNDAVQECIARAEKPGALREDRYMKTWVTRIPVNVCRDLLEKKKREYPCAGITAIAPQTSNPVMIAAFRKLEKPLRLPVHLHYIEGCSVKEAAGIPKKPEKVVKTRLQKAISLLRKFIGELEGVLDDDNNRV